jgi:ribonuclease P protein component
MRPSPFVSVRIGVVVPRFGHTAVERNQLKRRLRELVRAQLLPRKDAIDVVLWAQSPAYNLSFVELESALQQLVRRM